MNALMMMMALSTASAWEVGGNVNRMTDAENHYAVAAAPSGAMVLVGCTTELPDASLILISPNVIDSSYSKGSRKVSVQYRGEAKAETVSGLLVTQDLTTAIDISGELLKMVLASESKTALFGLPTYRKGVVVHEFDTTGLQAVLDEMLPKCSPKEAK